MLSYYLDLLRGNAAAAPQDAQLEPKGFWQYYALALAQQAQSDHAAADAALQTLIDKYAVGGPFQIATVYGLRKEPDKMLSGSNALIPNTTPFDPIVRHAFHSEYRDDPRFAALSEIESAGAADRSHEAVNGNSRSSPS